VVRPRGFEPLIFCSGGKATTHYQQLNTGRKDSSQQVMDLPLQLVAIVKRT